MTRVRPGRHDRPEPLLRAGRLGSGIRAPLSGPIGHDVGDAGLTLAVAGLPGRELVAVNWSNDAVRSYVVASFETEARGVGEQSSLRFFRPGETRRWG